MSTELNSFFLDNGIYQEVSPGGRFSLQENNVFWYVSEGVVDVFLTSDHTDSNNQLHHLVRLTQGQIIIGSENLFHHEWILIARNCSNTKVIKVNKENVLSFPAEAKLYLSEQIDDFIIKITKETVIETFPSNTLYIDAVQSIHLEAGTNLSAEKGVLWAKAFNSNSLFLSDSGSIMPAYESFFPITPYCWFEIEKSTSLMILSTYQLLNTVDAWNWINQYYLFALKLKLVNIESSELYDSVILYEKVENNQFAIQESLYALRDSFQNTNLNFIHYEKSNDPVYVSCMHICSYLNISLKPISVQTRALNAKDYFSNLMAYSKIFYRKVRLESQWYQLNQGPILAFEDNTPVALIPKSQNQYWLYEGTEPYPKKLNKQKASRLNPFAYILYHPYGNKLLYLKDFIKKGMQNYYYQFFLLIFAYSITALLALVMPFLTRYIFDEVIVSNNTNILYHILIILLAVLIATSIFTLTKSYLSLNLESRIDCTIQSGFWDRILKLPISFFKKFPSGELASRIGNLVEVRNILTGRAIALTLDSIFSISSFIVMYYYQPLLAGIITAFIIIFLTIYYFLTKQRLRYEDSIVLKSATIFGVLSELFLGITKIRLAGAEYRAFLNWALAFTKLQEVVKKSQKTVILTNAIVVIIPTFLLGIMYISIGWLFHEQAGFSTGSFLAFNTALGQVTSAVYHFMEEITHTVVVAPLYNKSKIFLETPPEISEEAQDPGEIKGDIEISKVSFKYPHSHGIILKDININIASGEYVAIVGKSGAGKSTLLRLLLGFDKPTNGRIYFDSKDTATLDFSLIRRQFGVVLQHDDLNPGSVFSNISGVSDLTIEEAWMIAEKAGIAEDILDMPMQMNTLINLEGSGLSGGQKQRLLIARAIARNPKVLILDEATRALDNVTQKMVIDSLSKMKMTRIVVAHRLSTLVQVDKIFVLEDGYIIEVGNYDELLAKEGAFYQLVQKQLV